MISKYIRNHVFISRAKLTSTIPVMAGGLLGEARRDNIYLQFLVIMRHLCLVYLLVSSSEHMSHCHSQFLPPSGHHSAFRLDLICPSAGCQDIRNFVRHILLPYFNGVMSYLGYSSIKKARRTVFDYSLVDSLRPGLDLQFHLWLRHLPFPSHPIMPACLHI